MMTPERWQKVRDVLEQALELAPEKRARFLDLACSSDAAMRSEVQSLLSASEEARSSFLETPPLRASGLSPGIKLGDYEIVSQIGSGGMGVVYRARDVRLGRDVAIKVLPAHLLADPSRLKRFEQEAQSAASLNHPNILAVHQLGAYEGAPYLVSELLEGETLREELRQGALPQPRLLDYGEQIADGLSAAHERGIIHRDLKPENLFVTKDARVKILDFGLAKLAHGESDSAETLATLALQTHPGTIAGTVGYMSPEQVRGEKLDTRTDLFSFGVVLYEMATGKRPFDGDTSGVTFEAILNRQPTPPTKLNAKLAPELERIITKALEKDREVRYQHASDIRADLKRLRRDSESGHTATHTAIKTRKFRTAYWVTAILALLLAVTSFVIYKQPGSKARPAKQVVERNLTATAAGNVLTGGAISPDGKVFAYSDLQNGLTLLQIDTGEKRVFSEQKNLEVQAWYPDGTHLLVATEDGHQFWNVSTFDGSKRKVLEDTDEIGAARVAPDGTKIAFRKFGPPGELWLMGPDGENPKRIRSLASEGRAGISDVAWAPTSQRILFSWIKWTTDETWESTISSCDLAGGSDTKIISDPALVDSNAEVPLSWSRDGRILFHLGNEVRPNMNLWSLPVDPKTGQVAGDRSRVTTGTGFTQSRLTQSADGARLIFLRERQKDDVWIGEIASNGELKPPQAIGGEDWYKGWPAWAPDSRAVVFSSSPYGKYGIYRYNLVTHETHSLVSGDSRYSGPVMTRDGKWLLFTHDSKLMRIPIEGGPSSLLLDGNFSYDCAPDADVCVLSETQNDQHVFSLLNPLAGRGGLIGQAKCDRHHWRLAPDGKRLACVSDNYHEIEILNISTHDWESIKIAGIRLQDVCWSADGQHFYVTSFSDSPPVDEILRVDMDGKHKSLYRIRNWQGWLTSPKVSPDGRLLAFQQRNFEFNAVLLENY